MAKARVMKAMKATVAEAMKTKFVRVMKTKVGQAKGVPAFEGAGRLRRLSAKKAAQYKRRAPRF